MKNSTKFSNITYAMLREDEAKEAHINMPIPEKRYRELLEGLVPDSKAWNEVRDALLNFARLQGYDGLGAWSIELTIGTEDD